MHLRRRARAPPKPNNNNNNSNNNSSTNGSNNNTHDNNNNHIYPEPETRRAQTVDHCKLSYISHYHKYHYNLLSLLVVVL